MRGDREISFLVYLNDGRLPVHMLKHYMLSYVISH